MKHRSMLTILTVTAIAVGTLTTPATAATPHPLWHAYPLGHAPLSTNTQPTTPHILQGNSRTSAGHATVATKRPGHQSGSQLWLATAVAGILGLCLLGATLRTTLRTGNRISDRRQPHPLASTPHDQFATTEKRAGEQRVAKPPSANRHTGRPDPPSTTWEALGPQQAQPSRVHTPRRRHVRRQGGVDMPDQTQRQAKRDPLVDHAVPLLAKAMLITKDRDDLWAYFHDRVESECHRIEDTAIREALEPLHERFAIDAVARVATAMAREKDSQEQPVTSS